MMSTAKYPSWSPDYRKAYGEKYRRENAAELKKQKADYYAKNKERLSLKNKAYYQANKDSCKNRTRIYQQTHKETVNAGSRKRYREKHEHYISKGRLYSAKRTATGKAAAYREKIRDRQRAWSRARSAKADDDYARELLSKYSTISAKDWPQELVEAKKVEIQLKRQIKKHHD